jgi:hypothetical protein
MIDEARKSGLQDLIEALTILKKYGDARAPTHCEHDVFRVSGICVAEDAVAADDAKRLNELGFHWDDDFLCWYSYRFGSC